MPTFTTVALDTLIEPKSYKKMAAGRNIPDSKPERTNSTPISKQDRGISVPIKKTERYNSTTSMDRNHHWAQISPALYATPEPTPLPDSPLSFPPSPYIVNHKRRGPRLLKSFSEDDVANRQQALVAEEKTAEVAKNSEVEIADSSKIVDIAITVPSAIEEEHAEVVCDVELGSTELSNGNAGQDVSAKSVTFERDGETEDFFDPQDSMSVKSNTDGESNYGMDRSLNVATPIAEFYDAWEELSSESGPQLPLNEIEAELREVRLSLLMEIEKRKQAEDALYDTRIQWLRIREQLLLVGLTLPADPLSVAEGEQVDDPAEELCRQVHLARFVSNSIGRGTAKAEVEVEMETQLELKNFEIARLLDRLHYYEAVNHEMSQRNQETVETMRRLRQRRKRRQRWVWGSIAAAITLGSAALAWSYLPSGKGSSSTNPSLASERDHSAQ